MLYTIGNTFYYEKYFQEQGTPMKLGKGIFNDKEYNGGSIWLSIRDAVDYLDSQSMKDYSVYGIDCNIEDTEEVPGQSFRNLLKTSRLVKLDL